MLYLYVQVYAWRTVVINCIRGGKGGIILHLEVSFGTIKLNILFFFLNEHSTRFYYYKTHQINSPILTVLTIYRVFLKRTGETSQRVFGGLLQQQ